MRSPDGARALARAAAAMEGSSLPPEVRDRAIDLILDTLAVAASASADAQWQSLAAIMRGPDGASTLVGDPRPVAPPSAALLVRDGQGDDRDASISVRRSVPHARARHDRPRRASRGVPYRRPAPAIGACPRQLPGPDRRLSIRIPVEGAEVGLAAPETA